MIKLLRLFCKVTLFFNAFLIMNILFLGKEVYLYATVISEHNNIVLSSIILISAGILLGLLGLIFIFRRANNVGVNCKVIHKRNETGNFYFGYFSLFVLLFMSFNMSNLINLITFTILILVLAIVYCRNDLFYINPTIFLLGKRIYALKIIHNEKITEVNVITSEKIALNKEYKFYFSQYEFTTCVKI